MLGLLAPAQLITQNVQYQHKFTYIAIVNSIVLKNDSLLVLVIKPDSCK